MESQVISVLVVDDHALHRDGTRHILEQHPRSRTAGPGYAHRQRPKGQEALRAPLTAPTAPATGSAPSRQAMTGLWGF